MKKKISVKLFKYLCPIVIGVCFFISLVPILALSGYDCATGDDLGYGTLTHIVWMSSCSITDMWEAICNTVKNSYYSWQGTWFTLALMTLQPEVFSSNAYWITPWIMLFITIASTTLVMKSCVAKYFDLPTWAWLSIDMIILFSMIQFFPSTASGIFWFNGGAHYIIPYGLALLTVHFFFKYRESRKKVCIIGAGITMTALGGSSYFMPLLVIVILGYLFIYDIVTKKVKPIWIMLIPAAFEIVGLVVSFLSPGNKNRGGKEFGLSVPKVIETIGSGFKEAVCDIYEYPIKYPIIAIGFVIIGMVTFVTFRVAEKRTCFKLPGLMLAACICLNAVMYMPTVFAGVDVSGGVPNTNLQVYILTATVFEIYAIGWLNDKLGNIELRKLRMIFGLLLGLCAVAIVLCRSNIKESTMYKSYIYLSSGQADDFRAQIQYNKSILLDSNIKECYLCPINSEQGPLMHMPVVEDINNFTNSVNRSFYQKDLVVVDTDLCIQSER